MTERQGRRPFNKEEYLKYDTLGKKCWSKFCEQQGYENEIKEEDFREDARTKIDGVLYLVEIEVAKGWGDENYPLPFWEYGHHKTKVERMRKLMEFNNLEGLLVKTNSLGNRLTIIKVSDLHDGLIKQKTIRGLDGDQHKEYFYSFGKEAEVPVEEYKL
jgi:hypothetical protein